TIRKRSAEVEGGPGGQALQPVPATQVLVLGSHKVRRMRRRLHRLFARAARVLRCPRPWNLHEQADDRSTGSRTAGAARASRKADAPGLLRGILPRVREGDEPTSHGATGRAEWREARAGTRQARDSEGHRSNRRWREGFRVEGPHGGL